MKDVVGLTKNWRVKGFCHAVSSDAVIKKIMDEKVSADNGWLDADMPRVVQEILFDKGLLSKEVLETGEADYCKEISAQDWVYRTKFMRPQKGERIYLDFKGLDTVADVFLNGAFVSKHLSMFLAERTDISDHCKDENELLLYFYSPAAVIEELKSKLPDRYEKKIGANALLRKPHGDFSSHGGVIPYFTPIGVFDDINIVGIDKCEILHSDIDIRLNGDLSSADIVFRLECDGDIGATIPIFVLKNPDGAVCLREMGNIGNWYRDSTGKSEYNCTVKVNNPQLWWPKNYGNHPLYKVEISLCGADEKNCYDKEEKTIGFRKIETVGDMKFRVNGKVIKIWGSCITPMWGPSHRWQRERGFKILEYAEKANMNALRLWGPSQPYHEEFYEQCNRLGILIWQEFHTWGTHMPDLPEYTRLVLQEAEAMIRRLKHNPCVFMWCGGNEQIYMADLFDKKAKIRFGHDIIRYHLKNLVSKMDPYRYYHVSSPSTGQYANEAGFGDTHGSRASRSYLPGEAYAHFFSEDIRTSIPELKSLKRFIKAEDLWPEGYKDTQPYGVIKPLPESWMKRTINHMEEKTGPYELFYDATDPESLVYKINAAASYDSRLIINRLRQGKPFYNSMAERSCNGYLVWKLNTAWPQIYCALVDYYLEPGQTYYSVRRAYAPLHISVDLQDHVYIWGTNDTSEDFYGKAHIEIFDLDTEEMLERRIIPAGLPAGDSLILKNLDDLGQFARTSVIHAVLLDMEDRMIDEDFQYVKPERKLTFPEAKLTLEKTGEKTILIATDRFARCVELSGDCQGENFGWHFEDNYFDLMPGQSRQIKYFGKFVHGIISARSFYSPHKSSLSL
jgi:hypothetical protein